MAGEPEEVWYFYLFQKLNDQLCNRDLHTITLSLDGVEITIADVIDERILRSGFDANMGRKIILRDVDPERVSSSLDKFLVGDLSFSGEKPIDKHLRRIRVGCSIHQGDVSAA